MAKTLTLNRPGLFCFLGLRVGVGGGGGLGARSPPLYDLKTAHPTATKITHNNVLIIFNFWALLD